ncbi:MAG: hypothetical protein AB1349_02500 [Elusimicrobiota bacterium]
MAIYDESDESQQVQKTNSIKKEIKNLYRSAERFKKKKKILSAVEKYKKILEIEPEHKKAQLRLSDIYTELKYKLDEKILYKSEDVYYNQSILYFINDDLTAAINEWGKCLAITPGNDEVKKFLNKTKELLAQEYQLKKQQDKEAKIKKLLEEGIELFNAEKYDESAEKFQAIIKLTPRHILATFYLEEINDIKSTPAKAQVRKKTVRKEPEVIKIDYEKADEFYNQGLKEYAAGHLSEAIELWKVCLKYNPAHEKARVNIEKAKSAIRKE